MSINEFDKLIVDRFDEQELEFNPAQWAKLSQQLPAEKKTIAFAGWKKITGIAAALILGFTVFAWIHNQRTEVPSIATKTPEHSRPDIDRQEEPAIAAKAPVTEAIATQPPATENNILLPSARPSSARNGGITVTDLGKERVIAQQAQLQPAPGATVDGNATEDIRTATPGSAPLNFAAGPKVLEKEKEQYYPDVDLAHQPKQNGSRTSISVAGGLNYGSMNTGYAAGITAKQKLGSRTYVEGDLAFVSNRADQASMTNSQFEIVSNGFDIGSAGVMDVPKPSVNSFNYVQFAPSFGYQVLSKLSLSVGADIQRLLGHDGREVKVAYIDDQPKMVPEMDLGFTGKTEVAITPKLRAGLLYREGVNNLVRGKPAAGEYLDRRYLQVQVKLTVFDKR